MHVRSIQAWAAVAAALIGVGWTADLVEAHSAAMPGDAAQVVAERAGDVTLLDADTRQRELTRGVSATEFAVVPPDGAECPGDSEHDSWRVQTFIVPAGVDPATIPYGADWPRYSEHMYSLYDTITQPVVDVLTVPSRVDGGPGIIDQLPPVSFAVFPVGELPPGRYLIGIACTLFHVTGDYWDTEIVISTAPDDSPGQMAWRLAGTAETAPESTESDSSQWLLAAVAGGAAAVVGLIWFRRRRRIDTTSIRPKESQ